MSLDDESPTQYFGPDGVTFTGPHGKPITVSKDHYLRLTLSGALTDEQMLNAKENGLSLQDILDEANRPLEEYPRVISLDNINTNPLYEAPFKHPGTLGKLSHKPLATEEDILAEIDAMRADLTMEDAAAISAAGRNPDALPPRAPGTADEEYVQDLARMLEIHARTIAVQNELIRELKSLLKSSRKGYWFAAGFASICAAAAGTLAAQTGVF